MARNLDKLTVLERGCTEVAKKDLYAGQLAGKARGSIRAGLAGKICTPEELNGIAEVNGLLFDENLLDLSDLEDEEPIDLVNLIESEDSRQTLPPPPKTEAEEVRWLPKAMRDYAGGYRKRFRVLCSDKITPNVLYMQKTRLTLKAHEFDDALRTLCKQGERRSAGDEPKYFSALESVRPILGEDFVEEVRKCHFVTEDDFARNMGNRIAQEQMDYLTKGGRYNPEFANDLEGVLERRQAAYEELDRKLEEMSLEYALIDIDEIKSDLNIPRTRDTETDDLYFGGRMIEKIDNMLKNGASPEALKKEMLIAIKQSVHHEMTTLCRDNNEKRVKMRPLDEDGKEWARGVDGRNLDSLPLAGLDALFSIAVRVARKSASNAIHRDNYLLGKEAVKKKTSVNAGSDDEISFKCVI